MIPTGALTRTEQWGHAKEDGDDHDRAGNDEMNYSRSVSKDGDAVVLTLLRDMPTFYQIALVLLLTQRDSL